MPFPKGVKRPTDNPDIPLVHRIDDFNGQELLLKESAIQPNQQYGDGLMLYCETEDGKAVKILTFSQVIAEQVAVLADHLPLIIKPLNNGTYYTIY